VCVSVCVGVAVVLLCVDDVQRKWAGFQSKNSTRIHTHTHSV